MPNFWRILNLAGFGYGVYVVFRDKSPNSQGKASKSPLVFQNPVPGSMVTSVWPDDRAYLKTKHYGLDFRAPKGTLVYASIGGIVTTAIDSNSSTAGKHVIIKTDNLPTGTGKFANNGMVNTRYLHLDSVAVKVGEKVSAGSVIGTVGDTYGPVAGGSAPHLHYDMFGNQSMIDYYKANFGTPRNGFPPARSFGLPFPSEPFIQARYNSASVMARATSAGVPISKGSA